MRPIMFAEMGRLVLVTGGARSGKSACAEGIVAGSAGPVTYLATAEALDEEMAERIRRHQRRRAADWRTVEAPRDADRQLAELVARPGTVLFDCLTLFLSNLIESGGDESLLGRVGAMARAAAAGAASVVIVTNEVGLGIVPENPLARRFRDLMGLANQLVAREAHEVYFTVCGLAQRIK